MKKTSIMILCLVLCLSLLTVAAFLVDKDRVYEGPVSSGSENTGGGTSEPEDIYLGSYITTSTKSSTETKKISNGGELGYVTVGDITYYFVRYDVRELDKYSVNYTVYSSDEHIYPYFSVYRYSADGKTWRLLSENVYDSIGSFNLASGIPGTPDYIFISVYAETDAVDHINTLEDIRSRCANGPVVYECYITNIFG